VFDHVTIRASDRPASEAFYTTVLAPLDIEPSHSDEQFAEWNDFSLAADGPVTRRLHIGFRAPSREHVDAFWVTGDNAGYQSDGEPGPRPQYRYDHYGAFLLDPDGNSAEAVHHGAMPQGGWIDHLWIRVPDVTSAKRFYDLVAPHARFRLKHDSPERAQFVGDPGSFSLVTGEPTEHVHLAFPAATNEIVDAFHRSATEAGYQDNGPPGERPIYHPGYYSAFILDSNGHNIELVNHNR
jgi:catechol 2,3-dioxygenase-like lactoylglutathione lyase family enzyme